MSTTIRRPQFLRVMLPAQRRGERDNLTFVWVAPAAVESLQEPTAFEVPAYDDKGSACGTTRHIPWNFYSVTFCRGDRREWGFAEPIDVARVLGIT